MLNFILQVKKFKYKSEIKLIKNDSKDVYNIED